MAIGVGSIVAIKISSVVSGSALTPGSVSSQPPCFGSVESASTPFTVNWANNGSHVASIAGTSLDEITTATTPTLALRGKVVGIAGYSPNYNASVISAYARSGVDYVLLKAIAGNFFLEVLASTVAAIDGQ